MTTHLIRDLSASQVYLLTAGIAVYSGLRVDGVHRSSKA